MRWCVRRATCVGTVAGVELVAPAAVGVVKESLAGAVRSRRARSMPPMKYQPWVRGLPCTLGFTNKSRCFRVCLLQGAFHRKGEEEQQQPPHPKYTLRSVSYTRFLRLLCCPFCL